LAELIVVSGAPASGKTTLARLLGDRAALQVLEKDALKEALSDALGHPSDVAASNRLGSASYAALFTFAHELLIQDIGLIIESNFRRGVSESELLRVAALASSTRLIHCTAPDDVLAERYQSRFNARARHPAHLDDLRQDALEADLAAGRYEPLAVDWPTLVVQTTSGYEPHLEQITAFVVSSAVS